MRMYLIAACLFCTLICVSCAPSVVHTDDVRIIGHWKLQGDCKDYSGMGNNGINHGVNLSELSAAQFDGIGAYIEVSDSPSLKLGDSSFSMSAWVKCEPGARVVGDIINKYDSGKRKGVNFHIFSSAPGYSSVSNTRNVLFGIDNGIDGEWVDCGRPLPTNSLISILIVYKNHLYAGIADASDPQDACRIFRYDGGEKWVDCGRVSEDLKTPSIMSAVIHNGELYVGTGKWIYTELPTGGAAGVYRYLGGTSWQECGAFSKGKRICTLASYNGSLYASDDGGNIVTGATYRYDNNDKWTFTGGPSSYKFLSTMVYRGNLYGGASVTINRFDGYGSWIPVGNFDPKSIDQVHSLGVYQGLLYAGTWSDGLIMRYNADGHWTDCGWVGTPETVERSGYRGHNNEINDLIVYNGRMYLGVIPKGEVWRYDGGQKSTMIKRLVNNEEYSISVHDSWCRVPCMAIYQGRLYAGTSTATGKAVSIPKHEAGKVFSWESGKCVTYDDDLGSKWRHLVAVREQNQLKLFIDGKLVSFSSAINSSLFNLDNDSPLLIGFGAENYFKGSMRDVRIYSGALSESEVSKLYRKSK